MSPKFFVSRLERVFKMPIRKLYTFINSICTQKVFITLAEKNLDYDMHMVDLFRNEQYSPEYLKLNPKGVVPTLVDGDNVITESTLICEYLDESYPEPHLMPATPSERASMRLWSKLVDESIFNATGALSFVGPFREKMKHQTEEQRQERYRNVGDPERHARFKSLYEEGVESPYAFQSIGNFEKMFKLLEQALAESGGPWILGDEYTLADINLTPYIYRVEYLTLLDLWLEDKPLVQQWWSRARIRPSALETIPGRLSDNVIADMNHFGKLVYERVAERRDEYLSSMAA